MTAKDVKALCQAQQERAVARQAGPTELSLAQLLAWRPFKVVAIALPWRALLGAVGQGRQLSGATARGSVRRGQPMGG
jgi:hypothetical protein